MKFTPFILAELRLAHHEVSGVAYLLVLGLLPHRLSEPPLVRQGVDQGRRDAPMPKRFLHEKDVARALVESLRERVAKRVRRDRTAYPGLPPPEGQPPVDVARRDALAVATGE